MDPILQKSTLVRISQESQTTIPLPPKKNPFKDQAGKIYILLLSDMV